MAGSEVAEGLGKGQVGGVTGRGAHGTGRTAIGQSGDIEGGDVGGRGTGVSVSTGQGQLAGARDQQTASARDAEGHGNDMAALVYRNAGSAIQRDALRAGQGVALGRVKIQSRQRDRKIHGDGAGRQNAVAEQGQAGGAVGHAVGAPVGCLRPVPVSRAYPFAAQSQIGQLKSVHHEE